MTCVLAIDSSLGTCSVAVLRDGRILSEQLQPASRGQAALLPGLVRAALEMAGLTPAQLDLVAATVGPGSFTGLRAGLALAHGIGLAAGIPVIGVTVAEALAAAVSEENTAAIDAAPAAPSAANPAALPADHHRELWVAIDSRRGRIFLDRDGVLTAVALDALPRPAGPVAICGDASIQVTARLAARGADVRLTDSRLPRAAMVGAVALRRYAGLLAPLAAQPLYVDPPEARLPAGGLRPMPLA
jgi:tRNA threonylcarbamoyladenosine biosynthesis protein TsaB